MLTKEQLEYLNSVYYNPKNPAAFSGLQKLWSAIKKDAKVTKKQLKEWLLSQDTYTDYLPAIRKFQRPKTISPKVDHVWGSDVAYMLPFSEHNDGYAYFVVFIDIFSRYAYAHALKTLRGKEMKDVMTSIFTQRKPKKLFTDGGSEYNNSNVERYLKIQDIQHYTSKSEKKVAHAERLIKQLKKGL